MEKTKRLVIIDHGMGNVRSVSKAFELLAVDVLISNQVKDIERAERLVLPGVGAFGQGMENLKKLGLIEPLSEQVLKRKKPILGICLGLQFLAQDSQEFGLHQGLAWLRGSVKILEPKNKQLKVPHVGWNNVRIKPSCPLFKGVKQNSCFYFVHSFHIVPEDQEVIAATCDYGQRFVAAVHKDNIFATQFHPEKSQTAGLKLLQNFLDYQYQDLGS